MSSTAQGSSPTLIHYLFLFWLRTRSETFQPQRRVQVVKDQASRKRQLKAAKERSNGRTQHMMIVGVDQACGGFVGASSKRGESLSFSLVAIPAEARAAVKGRGAQRSNRRRRPKALDGGPNGGYPAQEEAGRTGRLHRCGLGSDSPRINAIAFIRIPH
jgi:hypothetical protein